MLTVFGYIFLFSLYFPHSDSNIEAQIGLIVLQTCLWPDQVFEVNVLTFASTKISSQKLLLI